MLAPFSGLPASVRSTLALILGAAVATFGFAARLSDVRRMRASAAEPSAPVPPTGFEIPPPREPSAI